MANSNMVADDGFYLTAKAGQHLKKYKYSGSDSSYVYVYLLSPMNVFLIQFFPLWLGMCLYYIL